LLSNAAVYNLNDGKEGIMGLFSKFVKRRVPIEYIEAITFSLKSSEFVIHIPKEYDYRYSHAIL